LCLLELKLKAEKRAGGVGYEYYDNEFRTFIKIQTITKGIIPVLRMEIRLTVIQKFMQQYISY